MCESVCLCEREQLCVWERASVFERERERECMGVGGVYLLLNLEAKVGMKMKDIDSI